MQKKICPECGEDIVGNYDLCKECDKALREEAEELMAYEDSDMAEVEDDFLHEFLR